MRRIVLLLAALALLLGLPLALVSGQVCAPTATARGGGVFTLYVDSVAQPGTHTAERAALTRALGLYRADSTRVVEYEQLYRVRIGGCAGSGRTIYDTTFVDRPVPFIPDTLRIATSTGQYVIAKQGSTWVVVSAPDTTPPVVPPPPPPVVPPPPPPPVVPPPAPPVDTTPAPPGVPLAGYWDATWRDNWRRNRSHPLWQLTTSNCARTATPQERYGDTGLWCALVYKVEDDRAAAQKAIAKWLASNPQEAGANHRREYHIEGAVMYAALRPEMSAADEAAFRARLIRWAEIAFAVNTAQYVGGTRTNDEDQLIGAYMGLQCADRALGTTWASYPTAPTNGTDGGNGPALRSAVQHAIDASAGGELSESFAYNAGTAVLLQMGLQCLPGEYVNGGRFIAHRAQYHPFSITPDLLQKQQWRDEEHPRDFQGRLFKNVIDWLVSTGLSGNPGTARLVEDVCAKYGWTGFGTCEPWARALLLWSPGQVAPAARPVRGSHLATGRGHLYVLTDVASVLLAAAPRTFEDHEWDQLSNVTLYRDGEWAVKSLLGYAGWLAQRAEGTNGISLAGLGAMRAQGWAWADSGSGWWALGGQTSGPLYDEGYFDPPPAFGSAQRTAVYAEVGNWSVVITRDSVVMQDPRALPKFNRYRTANPNHQAIITAAEGKRWTIWHAPNGVAVNGNLVSWQTPGGQSVLIHLLADAPVTTRVLDELSTFGAISGGVGPPASELGQSVQATTTVPVLWSVVLVGRGTPPVVTRSADRISVGGVDFVLTSADVTGP